MVFLSHLKSILWKEFLLWKRNKLALGCTIILPIILMMVLVILRHVITYKEIEPKVYTKDYEAFSMDIYSPNNIINLQNKLVTQLVYDKIGQNAGFGVVKGSTISDKFIEYVQKLGNTFCAYIYIYIYIYR